MRTLGHIQFALSAVVLMCPVMANSQPALSSPFSETRIIESPPSTSIAVPGSSGGAKLHYTLIDKRATSIRIFTPQVVRADPTLVPWQTEPTIPDRDGLTLAEYARESHAKIVVPASYLRKINPPTPLGFLKTSGRILTFPSAIPNPNEQGSSGAVLDALVCISKSFGIEIQDTSGWTAQDYRDRSANRPDCIQVGPIFLKNGETVGFDIDSHRQNKDRRTLWTTPQFARPFICADENGNGIVGTALGAPRANITMNEIAPSVAKLTFAGGKCTTAALLVGGIFGGYWYSDSVIGSESAGTYEVPSAIIIW